MGPRQVEQGALFYNFSIDAHVPADHLLRSIDRFVDLSELRRDLAPFYSSLGRPSVDPELMIRMPIIGYCVGSGPSGASAKRSTSIWRTGGSAGSGSTAMSPIIPPSRRRQLAPRPWRVGLLRLLHQLSDRSRQRDQSAASV